LLLAIDWGQMWFQADTPQKFGCETVPGGKDEAWRRRCGRLARVAWDGVEAVTGGQQVCGIAVWVAACKKRVQGPESGAGLNMRTHLQLEHGLQ
jgi:hypothetical protein